MSTASDIVAGLGGQENITDLEPCITRLRVEVADQTKVDEEALRAAGAFGVVRSGRVVQVVVGPTADSLASEDRGSLTDHPVPGRSARSPGSSTFNVESGDLSVLLHHSVQHSDSFGLMSRTGHRPCPPACRSSTGRVVPGAPSSSFSTAVAPSRHLTVKQLQQNIREHGAARAQPSAARAHLDTASPASVRIPIRPIHPQG